MKYNLYDYCDFLLKHDFYLISLAATRATDCEGKKHTVLMVCLLCD